MPNIWAHFIFGQDLMEQLGHGERIARNEARKLFNLGCQGPDFLFYHHFLPWQKDDRLNRLGSRMHKERCGDAIRTMLRAARESRTGDGAPLYGLGFLLHHVLDRNMHPFVFARSGFRKWDHQRFEVAMDTIVAKRMRGIETWRTPVWREIDVGERLPEGVVDVLQTTVRGTYPDAADGMARQDWNDAYRDMIRAQKLFHDPSGLKRLLTAGQIRPLVFHRRLLPLDFMNDARTEWGDPTDESLRYADSAWDLWERAMEDGRRALSGALAYLDGTESELPRPLDEAIGNRSYETGKSCDSGLEIRFAEPIFD